MTLYELLRELTAARQWTDEARRRDANALIDELERTQALGTVAGQLDPKDHECVPAPHHLPDMIGTQYAPGWYTLRHLCKICGTQTSPDTHHEYPAYRRKFT